MNSPHSDDTTAAHKVLVLGDDYRMVLPIVRSLGRSGVVVHLAWCPASSPAAASRYAAELHDLPCYASRGDRWIRALDKLIEEHDFALVIPATEHAVFALQNARLQLEHQSRMYLLEDDAFRAVADKQATYQLCAQLQVPFPKGERLTHPDDFERLAEELGLPLIVKPCCSVTGDDALGKAYVRVCSTRADALRYVHYLHERHSGIMLQQYCPGEGVGMELLACQGEILVALQHRRLHETTGHGSTYRETVSPDPRLLGACQKLVRALGYTGVAMVEFRVDPENGRWALLEINGRFWGSLPLATAAGMDFPMHLFELLVRGRRQFRQHYRVGVRSRALANDLRWLWRRCTARGKSFDPTQAHNAGWMAHPSPIRQVITDAWRGITLQDHVDTFAWDDIRPARQEITCLLRDAWLSLWTSGINRCRALVSCAPRVTSVRSRAAQISQDE